jgi:hypothetical protein
MWGVNQQLAALSGVGGHGAGAPQTLADECGHWLLEGLGKADRGDILVMSLQVETVVQVAEGSSFQLAYALVADPQLLTNGVGQEQLLAVVAQAQDLNTKWREVGFEAVA